MCSRELMQVQEKWGKLVFPYLEELYKGHWLPSHDIAHHQRVWQNACQLIKLAGTNLINEDRYFAEKLFLACYFHDTGLLRDQSEYHGRESRIICEKFLSDKNGLIYFDLRELLEAIEKHDDKNYDTRPAVHEANLRKILSLADDMDAFGAIGVYRYIEIYLMRDIKETVMAERILQNAAKRYAHFKASLSDNFQYGDLFSKGYERLCKLLKPLSYAESPVTLIHWINVNIVDSKINPFVTLPVLNKEEQKNRRLLEFRINFSEETAQIYDYRKV